MILHLVTKHLVTNRCLSIFEQRSQGQNIVLALNELPCWGALPFVNNAIEVSKDNEESVVASLDFSKITHVVIHFLTFKTAVFVQKYIPKGIPIYWWTYGGDLYQPFLERRGYDLFYTDLTPFKPGWFYMVSRYTKTLIKRIMFKCNVFCGDRYMQTEFLDRIDGIIPCFPPDHEMACKYIKKDFKLVRIHPNGCPSYEEMFSNGNVVTIGHSASFTDNHLYALKYLSKIDIRDSVLSLTLSYNVNSYKYLDAVKKRYKSCFRDKVSFIEQYLSKEDFFKSQNQIGIMILPTWRQEALASVYSSFLRGIKLFLSKKGPMYTHFKEYGFKVFAIEEIDQTIFDTPLTLEEKMHNRSLTLQYLEEKGRLIDEDFKQYFGEYFVDDK